jgi:hypothetical protein
MADPSTLCTFGTTNGVSANPVGTAATPETSIICALLYNYFDDSLLSKEISLDTLDNENPSIVNLNPYVNPANANSTLWIEDPGLTWGAAGVTGITGGTGDVGTANGPLASYGDGYMSLTSFLNLFYSTNAGYFNVNASNLNNAAICLSQQLYASSNSDFIQFSLYQYILKSYTDSKGITVNDIDPRVKILLQKECFVYQSLAQVKGTAITLAWDQVVSTLVTSGAMIASPDPLDSAIVNFQVILIFHSQVLNYDLKITFNYLVPIPGYTNPTDAAALGVSAP